MTAPPYTIRPYQPSDRPSIRQICYRTGFMGEPADFYWRDVESFCDIWTAYYTDQEPESTFVVEVSGEVVGYLLGCVDTARAPSPETLILQQMRRRLLFLRPGTAAFFRRVFWDLLRNRRQFLTAQPSLEDFPSHLHIDLLPQARRLGAGRALMTAWFERLSALGSPGCHLVTLAENTRAIAFFESVGFRRLASPGLIPGLRNPSGAPLHQQVMVKEISPPSLP